MRNLIILLFVSACGDNLDPPSVDAPHVDAGVDVAIDASPDAFVLRCAAIQCTPPASDCHPNGYCTCPNPDGTDITLECVP